MVATINPYLPRVKAAVVRAVVHSEQPGQGAGSIDQAFLPALWQTVPEIMASIASISNDNFDLALGRATSSGDLTAAFRPSWNGLAWRLVVEVHEGTQDRTYTSTWFSTNEWQIFDAWCNERNIDVRPAWMGYVRPAMSHSGVAAAAKVAGPAAFAGAKVALVATSKAALAAGSAVVATAGTPVLVAAAVGTAAYGVHRHFNN
ncbi:hypothetical protein JCM8097_006516 [Rhodosporidiobolus ruineniae]